MNKLHHDDYIEESTVVELNEDAGEILLFGGINDDSSAKIVSSLRYLDRLPTCEEITMLICSSGGSVAGTMAIISQIKSLSKPIKLIGTGCVFSGGLFILASGKQGSRKIYSSCLGMLHGVIKPYIGDHVLYSIRDVQIELDKTMDIIFTHALSELTSSQLGKAKELCINGRDHYLTAEEMLEMGLVDEII